MELSARAPHPAPRARPAPAPSGPLRRCACGGIVGPEGECAACRARRLGLQRLATGPGAPALAPPIVHEVLRSPGRPLDAATRAFMEPRFGHDFSRIRVHTDARAAASARAVGALAYTVGQNIAFGTGQFAPGTTPGKRILAHELAHVIQQENTPALQSKLTIAAAGSQTEREADAASEQVVAGSTIAVRQRVPAPALHRLRCDDLLNAREEVRVNGSAAHAAIQADFVSQTGANAFPIRSIEGASFSHFDLNCGDVPSPTSIAPATIGGGAGRGYPDLALRASDNAVELAEIKPAHWTCVPEAETQVNNYVRQANRQRSWRQSQGLGTFRLMSTGSYTPRSPISVGAEPVTVGWCSNGVLVYKAIRDQDPEVFVCGTSDQGRIDRFLDNVLGRAQGEVDRYISRIIDPAITNAINRLSIRESVNLLYRYARGELLQKFGWAGPLVGQLPDEVVVDQIAQWIQDQVGPQAEQQLRNLAHAFKTRLLTRIRQRLQDQLRNSLQESLNALCAGAATVTAAMLMRELWRQMGRRFLEALDAEVEALARQAVLAVANAFLEALLLVLAIVAVVLIIIFLPEIVAGIAAGVAAAGAFAAELALAVAALGPALLRLLPQVQQLLPAIE